MDIIEIVQGIFDAGISDSNVNEVVDSLVIGRLEFIWGDDHYRARFDQIIFQGDRENIVRG